MEEFESRERMEGLIRLHSGALLSTGERVLSVARSLEKHNQSYWVLVNVIPQEHSLPSVHVAKIVHFVMCRLPVPTNFQNIRWSLDDNA